MTRLTYYIDHTIYQEVEKSNFHLTTTLYKSTSLSEVEWSLIFTNKIQCHIKKRFSLYQVGTELNHFHFS